MGAYGGRADLMRMIAPEGPVYQAGTLSGNPLAVAAGLATLRFLEEEAGVYPHLEALGRQLDEGFADLGARLGIPLRWNRVGGMGSLFFTDAPVTDWPSVTASSRTRFNAALPRPAGPGHPPSAQSFRGVVLVVRPHPRRRGAYATGHRGDHHGEGIPGCLSP